MSKTVLIPIADGTEEIEAVTMIDVLRRAGAQVAVASVSQLQITASRKVRIAADGLIAQFASQSFDCIALPGGMPGAEHLRDNPILSALLKQQHQAGNLYAAICASPAVILEPLGLLAGKKATCYPSMQDTLPDRSAASQRVVVDGNCITSQGPATAMEFALAIVEALFGKERRNQVAEPMLAE